MVRNCLLGYLKTILLKSVGQKALVTAKAMQLITNSATMEDSVALGSFISSVYLACEKFN